MKKKKGQIFLTVISKFKATHANFGISSNSKNPSLVIPNSAPKEKKKKQVL